MAPDTWLIFLAATIGLSLAPGPNGLLVLNHGARFGARMTSFTITGGVSGFLLLLALGMSGVGALLQSSPGALAAMRWLGGAYLVWLGVQVWRAPALGFAGDQTPAAGRPLALFREGWLVAVSNPKVLLFFVAFLPQFIDPQRDMVTQFAVMAATFAIVETAVEGVMARLAHGIRDRLQGWGRRVNVGCGVVFMLIGAGLAIGR